MLAVGSDASSPSSNNITFETELFSKRRHQGKNKHPAQAVYRTYHEALYQHCGTLKAINNIECTSSGCSSAAIGILQVRSFDVVGCCHF